MNVTKRSGALEPIDMDKIHRVVIWACEGFEDVSVSDIELKSHMNFEEGIKTSDIHKLLIKSAADLISLETPDYQFVAARLAIFGMRKDVYGVFEPPSLKQYLESMVARNLWDADLRKKFSDADLELFNDVIDHTKDLGFTYAAVKQWEGKYLVQDRVTKKIHETPQFAYMGISMVLFQDDDMSIRNDLIVDFYTMLSDGIISLPTPIMGGVRTPTRQFSSCVVIDTDDSLDSINATSSSIVKYVSQRAGIGVNVGKLRALGSPIRGGEVFHTGLIPFIKHFQTAVKSSSQGGLRGGSATLSYPIWHLEVESLLVLKNNRGVEENRARHLDYGVQLNKLMYQRLIQSGYITLFSPSDVDGLYEAFFKDQEKFEQLYVQYENDATIRKKRVPAVELFTMLMQERAQTGRIYIQNVDHMNTHSSFIEEIDPVRLSNLCVAGDTKILTRDGYKPIETLAGQTVECWNGEEWSMTPLFQTSDDEAVLSVVLSNGMTIEATPYHKWYIGDDSTLKRTHELIVDDVIAPFYNSEGLYVDSVLVFAVVDLGRRIPVYCGTEPKRNKLMFNGVLTGNCHEITLPTTPLTHDRDEDGEIALCTLAALNLGKINSLSEMEAPLHLIVRALDNLLTYQNYPVKAAEKAKFRRSLGVGVTNFAYWLAKNGLYYSNGSANNKVHNLFEAFQYYLIDASANLAKDRGACEWFNRTKYSQGRLPIDHYKTDIDNCHTASLLMDWEALRTKVKQYGMRNSTLSAQMPCETSSQITNSTNGIEPPRGAISIKLSKDGSLPQVVPDVAKCHYEFLWSIPNNQGYLELVGIMQKFLDQAISANTNYDPTKFSDGKVSLNQLIKDLLLTYKLGIKTLYYHNTRDGSGDEQQTGCESGGCSV